MARLRKANSSLCCLLLDANEFRKSLAPRLEEVNITIKVHMAHFTIPSSFSNCLTRLYRIASLDLARTTGRLEEHHGCISP